MNIIPETILDRAGIRPTPNRILVLSALSSSCAPMSLIELEASLQTLERSSVSRVLSLLLAHKLVHALEDGRGVTKYELCHGDGHCSPDDMHVHFYCEKCRKVFCFENVAAPHIDVPEGFSVGSVNYMLKGLCPDCLKK